MRSLFFQLRSKTQIDPFTPIDGQHFFSLSLVPKDRALIRFYVNDEQYNEADGGISYDANLNRVQSLLPFVITHTDRVRAEYTV